ncbi:MFS transporter [bacterium]|nr:MAG: MFS transporter [bacterium]
MLEFQKKLSNSFYTILGLPATAMGFALSVQIAVLSWILTTKYGLDIHEVGFVWAAGPIAGILGQPLVGLISDNVWFWGGRRRPFIIVGGILAAACILALPNIDLIASMTGIGSLMAVAITVALTLDLSINISFNPTRSIIADVTPEGEQRTKGYTWMQSISNLFGAVAYLIGATIDNYVLIYVGVVTVLVFSIFPLFLITEPKSLVKEEDEELSEEEKRKETNWPELWKIFIAHGFTWLGVQTMFVYIIAFLRQKMFTAEVVAQYDTIQQLKKAGSLITENLAAVDKLVSDETGTMIGISFFLLNAVGSIWPVFVLEPMTKKIGQVRTHYLALAIMAIGYTSIALFARNQWVLYGLMSVVSIGWGALVSLPFAIMSENVNKQRMGFFMGIFNLSVVLPQLIASLFVGSFIQWADNKTIVFWFSAISLAISTVLWTLVKETGGKSKVKNMSAH